MVKDDVCRMSRNMMPNMEDVATKLLMRVWFLKILTIIINYNLLISYSNHNNFSPAQSFGNSIRNCPDQANSQKKIKVITFHSAFSWKKTLLRQGAITIENLVILTLHDCQYIHNKFNNWWGLTTQSWFFDLHT